MSAPISSCATANPPATSSISQASTGAPAGWPPDSRTPWGPARRARAAPAPARPRLHRRLLRLPLRRRHRGADDAAAAQPLDGTHPGPGRGLGRGLCPDRRLGVGRPRTPRAQRAGPGGTALDRDRRGRTAPRVGLARASPAARRAGLPAVHVRLHRNAQGCRGQPRQPRPQRGALARGAVQRSRLHARQLAAPAPRHGPDRPRPAGALRGRSLHLDVAAALPGAARALVGSNLALPRHDELRAKLRLRPVRRTHRPGPARRSGPLHVDHGRQRLGARAARHLGTLRARVRPVRIPTRSPAPGLRPRRGHAARLDRRRARARAPLGRRRRARRGSRDRGAARARRRQGRRRLWPDPARPGDRDRRPRSAAAPTRRGSRRDLGARSERRSGLLETAAGHGADVRSSGRAERRGRFPAHGRLGVPGGGRALRHRSPQGHRHPKRSEPLPPGPRARARDEPRRPAAERGGRVRGRGRRARAPGRGGRSRAPRARQHRRDPGRRGAARCRRRLRSRPAPWP